MTIAKLNNKEIQKGFTLIELLVVIGILAVLLAIVLIAINPARQFAQANNTQRRSDVNAILNAVHQYAADHNGVLPGGGEITTTTQEISQAGADICTDLVTEYIADLPVDPLETNGVANCGANYETGYTVVQSATDNRVTVSAPLYQAPETSIITVTR